MFASWLLLVWISVAVPYRHPAGGIGPVVATQLPEPLAGLYRAADARVVVPAIPPAASTRPSASRVAVWRWRAVLRVPAALKVPAEGDYSSADVKLVDPDMPPEISILPLVPEFDPVLSCVAPCNLRAFAIAPVADHTPVVLS